MMMTKREWRQEFKLIVEKNAWAEKFDEKPFSKRALKLMDKDWKAFSRWRGYTEKEIADFERSLELYEIGLKLGYTDSEMSWICSQVIKKVWKARGIKMVEIDGQLKMVIGHQMVTSGNRRKRKNA
jgi:hypothetical protein